MHISMTGFCENKVYKKDNKLFLVGSWSLLFENPQSLDPFQVDDVSYSLW